MQVVGTGKASTRLESASTNVEVAEDDGAGGSEIEDT